VNHAEDHLNPFAGGKKSTSAASALEGGEGLKQQADTGAIKIADAGKVDGEAGGTNSHELPDLLAKGIFGSAELQGTFEVKNCDAPRAPNVDFQSFISRTRERK